MYLSKLLILSDSIIKCICPIYKMYLSQLWNVHIVKCFGSINSLRWVEVLNLQGLALQMEEPLWVVTWSLVQGGFEVRTCNSVCPNCYSYLSQLLNVFVQITRCIFPHSKMLCVRWLGTSRGRRCKWRSHCAAELSGPLTLPLLPQMFLLFTQTDQFLKEYPIKNKNEAIMVNPLCVAGLSGPFTTLNASVVVQKPPMIKLLR